MGLLYGENCVILASTVFDGSTRVTDRQTDGRTDGQTELPWHIRAIAYMLSRAKKVGKRNLYTTSNCFREIVSYFRLVYCSYAVAIRQQVSTIMLVTARIAAEQRSFNLIRQVASVCRPFPSNT